MWAERLWPARDWLRRPWAWALLALLVLWLAREPIGRWLVPGSEVLRQVEQGDAALARGELSRADGRGALEFYRAALAREPDNPAAREGLRKVAEAALQQTDAALLRGDFAAARAALALAQALAAPADALQLRQTRLRDAARRRGEIPRWLQQAQAMAADAAGREPALDLLAQLLAVDPQHPQALALRDRLLLGLLDQADAALAEGDLMAAQALLRRVASADPAHIDLPESQAELTRALDRHRRRQAQQLARAEARLRRGDAAGAARIAEALSAERPPAESAEALRVRAGELRARQAVRLAADFDAPRARAAMEEARRWAPRSGEVATAAGQVEASLLRAARVGVAGDARARAEVAGLLVQARAAMAEERWLEPPGESAWDLLRRAAAIAPREREVLAAQGEFAQRAARCHEEAIAASQLSRAQRCLHAQRVAEPGRSYAEAQLRLARAWLGWAEERLGRGDIAQASAAWERARGLAPRDEQVIAFGERLSQAQP